MNASETAALRARAVAVKNAAPAGSMSWEEAVIRAAEGTPPASGPSQGHLPAPAVDSDTAHRFVLARLAEKGLTDPRQDGYRDAYRRALADLGDELRSRQAAADESRFAETVRAHGDNHDILVRAAEIANGEPVEGGETQYQTLRRSIAQAGAERAARERGQR